MAQILKKVIANNAVGAAKARLENDAYLRGRNQADTSDISIIKVRTDDTLELGALARHNFTPTDPSHLANKDYVDNLVAGLKDLKDAVRVASTANIDLATGTLLTIDGVALSADDRVLVKNQTDAEDNGLYLAKVGAWVRSTDADTSAKVTQGLAVDVVEGTVNGRTRYLLSTADPITLGTTELTFVKIPRGASSFDVATEVITLDGTDITNQYVDLNQEAIAQSVQVFFSGVKQTFGVDYTLSVVSNVSRVTFDGDLETGGPVALLSGDVLEVTYTFYKD